MTSGPRSGTGGGRSQSRGSQAPGSQSRGSQARPSPVAAGTDTDIGPSGPGPAGRRYAETLVPEHPAAAGARDRAAEAGLVPVSPGTAAALTFLAATVGARSAVEVGTGTGVSALALLAGMRTGAILTSVDIEGAHQQMARTAMAEAGVAPTRARLINGSALDVLPRLTDGAYDVVFADADPSENSDYLTEALRLLRPGGVVAFYDALAGDAVADPGRNDPAAAAARELHAAVLDDERLATVLLPVGSGLLVASVVNAVGA